jgi:hypothetical protein
MVNQYVVSLAELQFVTIVCAKCKTEVTVDLKYEGRNKQPNTVDPVVPDRCPICESAFDAGLIRGLDSIRGAYSLIEEQRTARVEFGIKDKAK